MKKNLNGRIVNFTTVLALNLLEAILPSSKVSVINFPQLDTDPPLSILAKMRRADASNSKELFQVFISSRK